MRKWLVLLFLALVLVGTVPDGVWGQDTYETESSYPFWIRSLLDLRVVRGGSAPSWVTRGLGKTRYGGRSDSQGFDRVTRFKLSHLALEFGGTLPWGITAQAQLNWETDIGDDVHPLLIEAFFRKEWGEWEQGWGLQMGAMQLPFSLEHTGPAWTPLYTLTPSALNTWLWEEGRLVGAEGEWWRMLPIGLRLGVVSGFGFGPDLFGRLLAVRGWVLSDAQLGFNSRVPLPARRIRTSLYDEQDHRPALYTLFTVSDDRERAALRLGYFDNLGDQERVGVWETRFGMVGALLHPLPQMDLLVQYLEGTAHVRTPANDTGLSAFYALLSYHHRGHRVSVRYDTFRLRELDDAPPRTREHGDGVTLAYFFEVGLHHRIGFEYMFLHSHRPARLRTDPSDDGWQMSYRFRY